jgi:hypothetical protein
VAFDREGDLARDLDEALLYLGKPVEDFSMTVRSFPVAGIRTLTRGDRPGPG